MDCRIPIYLRLYTLDSISILLYIYACISTSVFLSVSMSVPMCSCDYVVFWAAAPGHQARQVDSAPARSRELSGEEVLRRIATAMLGPRAPSIPTPPICLC